MSKIEIDVRYETGHELADQRVTVTRDRALLTWGFRADHGMHGWTLWTLDDEHFIPGDLTDTDFAVSQAREWLDRPIMTMSDEDEFDEIVERFNEDQS